MPLNEITRVSHMKFRSIVLLFAGSAFLSIGLAQTDSSAPPQQDFATFKANMLARLEKETACVQAATDFDAMHACMPHPPGGVHQGPPPEK
jgi:hypothetical protein